MCLFPFSLALSLIAVFTLIFTTALYWRRTSLTLFSHCRVTMQTASSITILILLFALLVAVVQATPVASAIYSEDDVVKMRLTGHDEVSL